MITVSKYTASNKKPTLYVLCPDATKHRIASKEQIKPTLQHPLLCDLTTMRGDGRGYPLQGKDDHSRYPGGGKEVYYQVGQKLTLSVKTTSLHSGSSGQSSTWWRPFPKKVERPLQSNGGPPSLVLKSSF